jgi:hypothetical protein
LICSFNFLIFLAVCLNTCISIVINIKILTNSNQQTQSYKFTSHIAAFLSGVLITERLEICVQTSHDQNVQLILKSYLPVVYGTTLTYYKPTLCLFLAKEGSSWLWSYGSWIYNYLCNLCLSPLTLWIWVSLMARCTRYNIIW